MKRFVFRLERVLRVREAVLSMRQLELAGALAHLQREQHVLTAITDDLHESEARFRERAFARPTPWVLAMAADYTRFLAGEREKQRVEVEKAEDQVEISRHRLVEARQETRILERLKEKRRAAHAAEVLKSEQAILDEIGTTRRAPVE